MSEPRDRTGRSRRGSDVSERQIAFAVRDGKAVTAMLPDGRGLRGYVIGIDDYHWVIIEPDTEQVHLVHKSSPVLSIAKDSTLDGEPKAIKEACSSFRSKVTQEYFNQQPRQRK